MRGPVQNVWGLSSEVITVFYIKYNSILHSNRQSDLTEYSTYRLVGYSQSKCMGNTLGKGGIYLPLIPAVSGQRSAVRRQKVE